MEHSRRDVVLLFSARSVRLFAYGALSVVLALYLSELALTEAQIGLLFTLTLAGDAGISLWITTTADRIGRRKMLLLGAGRWWLAALLAMGMTVFIESMQTQIPGRVPDQRDLIANTAGAGTSVPSDDTTADAAEGSDGEERHGDPATEVPTTTPR